MTFCLKFIDINRLVNDSYSLVLLITVSLPFWCCKYSSLYSTSSFFFTSFKLSIELYRSVRSVSYLSVREVSVLSGLSSFASFLNDLNPGGNEGKCGGRHLSFCIPKLIYSWFGIVSFLGGDVESDIIFIYFPWMHFSGVTLALVSPVNPELTYR